MFRQRKRRFRRKVRPVFHSQHAVLGAGCFVVGKDFHPEQGAGPGEKGSSGLQVFPGIIYPRNQRDADDKRLASPAEIDVYKRQAFQYGNLGNASALGWILFLIILVMTMLVFKSSAVWVFYEGEVKNK